MKPRISLWIFSVLLLCLYPFFSYSFQFSRVPFIWIGIFLLVMLALLIHIFQKKTFAQMFFLYTAMVIAALTGFEAYIAFRGGPSSVNTKHEGGRPEQRDDILGYKPTPDNRYSRIKTFKEDLIFDVSYETDENGMRISPPFNADSLLGHCLFFGGSFTYGIGVENEEALPYQVGIESGGKFRTSNFGCGGYGPHQMLAALKSGIVKNIIPDNETPKYIFYQAIDDHVRRVAGWVSWDSHGPRFVFDDKGEIIHSGHFDDNNTFRDWSVNLLRKSKAYRQSFETRSNLSDKEIELYINIVNAAKRESETLFPQSKFYVIFWDKKKPLHEKIAAALQKAGLPVINISDILPTEKNFHEHVLHKYDPHPTANAYRMIADYLVENILPQ